MLLAFYRCFGAQNWSVEKLAETYKIRKERVLAILALRKVRVAFLEKCRTISGDQVCRERGKDRQTDRVVMIFCCFA